MPFYENDCIHSLCKRPALQAVNHKRVMQISPFFAKASITVEAALSVSLFLFSMYLLILPLNMFRVHRQMQAIVENVAEHACQYMYAKYTILPILGKSDGEVHASDEEKEQMEDALSFTTIMESGGVAVYAQSLAMSEIEDKLVSDIHPLGTWYSTKDEMICVRLNYAYNLPFGIFGFKSLKQSVQSTKRAWVGRNGMMKEENKKKDDEMVYVGKTSKRYHKSATCHYLFNDIRKVNVSHLSSMSNRFGKHYQACARCAKGIVSGEVYIMPSGTSYHKEKTCSAIIAYARKVALSDVEHLGACSYCGGGE